MHAAWSSGYFRERREKPTLISLVVGTQCPTIKVATYYWLNKSSWCHSSSLQSFTHRNTSVFRRLPHFSLGREDMPLGFKNSSVSSLGWLWRREQILLNSPQMSTDFPSFDFTEVTFILYHCKQIQN